MGAFAGPHIEAMEAEAVDAMVRLCLQFIDDAVSSELQRLASSAYRLMLSALHFPRFPVCGEFQLPVSAGSLFRPILEAPV